MIFEILAATMLVINLAAVVLTLSAIGHLHTRVADNARFQSVLFRKSLVAISDTLEAVSDTLTSHVTKEFECFLHCGILAYGFLRLRCEECHREKFLAFSCKKRGFCSSCGGRRMAESAAHLVDDVFPKWTSGNGF